MAIKAGNFVINGVTKDEVKKSEPKEVVLVEKTAPQENGTVMVDGRAKKFNKISRYMLDMLTTEE